MAYRHTQRARWIVLPLYLAIVAGITVLVASLLLPIPGRASNVVIAGVGLVVLILCLLFFRSLTVVVDSDRLHWRFGLDLWRWSVPVAEIESMREVRNPWWYGWGIHVTTGGWLYNIEGKRGVEFQLRGGRRFRLGTDDPEALMGAVRATARRAAG